LTFCQQKKSMPQNGHSSSQKTEKKKRRLVPAGAAQGSRLGGLDL
jgi:hypothetical protein